MNTEFQWHTNSPTNKVEGNTLTNRFGDVYRRAVTTKDIRGAAIGTIPAGTDCWIVTHHKIDEPWNRDRKVLRPVESTEAWQHRNCLGLKGLISVYEDEYKFVD